MAVGVPGPYHSGAFPGPLLAPCPETSAPSPGPLSVTLRSIFNTQRPHPSFREALSSPRAELTTAGPEPSTLGLSAGGPAAPVVTPPGTWAWELAATGGSPPTSSLPVPPARQ